MHTHGITHTNKNTYSCKHTHACVYANVMLKTKIGSVCEIFIHSNILQKAFLCL